MNKEEKIDIINEMIRYYNDVNELTEKEKVEFNNFTNELKEAINYARCCDKLPCKEDKTDEILEKLKECATQITELNTKDTSFEFTFSGQELIGLLKNR